MAFADLYRVDPLYLSEHRDLEEKWVRMRCDQVTSLVKKISSGIRALKKNIIISAAVFPNAERARRDNGQDWPVWARNGYIDLAVPMIYSADNGYVQQSINDNARLSDKSNVVIGFGAYKMRPGQLSEQMAFYRRLKTLLYQIAGFSLFSYDSMTAEAGYFEKIKADVL
jgi:uncharacterized lipoprotein YddW (UPF0748 family)